MRILILGFNGFLGRSIGHHAQRHGHAVYGLSRSPHASSASEIVYIRGDRTDVNQVERVALELQIDVVMDVIPMVIADTQPLLDCLDGKINQYVMLSSSDVYANYELLHRRISGKANRVAVGERSALRTTAYPYRENRPRDADDPDRYLDDYDKIPLEAAVRELSSSWTVLRLPMVYGPGDRQRRFRWAIAPMLTGKDRLVIPTRWANWQSTYGFIDNVGAAIASTLGNKRAFNQVFNVADETQTNQIEWANKFAEVIGWRGSIELTDDPDDPFQTQLANLDLDVPFKIDSGKLRRRLGISDMVSESAALEKTVASESSI